MTDPIDVEQDWARAVEGPTEHWYADPVEQWFGGDSVGYTASPPAEVSPRVELSTEDINKLRDIHAWLEEIMPTLRQAKTMFDNRGAFARRWIK